MSKRDGVANGVSWDTLVGLILGIFGVLYFFHVWPNSVVFQLYGDSVHYNLSARTMLTKHFYTYWGYGPDAQVTPGYPLFLVVCYWIAGHLSKSPNAGMHLAFVVQLLLMAFTASTLYWISRRALNRVYAAIVGLLWILYPTTHGAYGQILTEPVFVPLLVGFVWVFLIAMEKQKRTWWFVAGLVLGLAGLVRPTVFPLVAAGAIALLIGVFKSKADRVAAAFTRNFISFVVHVVGYLIPLVPWWVRNYVALHRILLTDTDAGNPLMFGADPNFAHNPTLGRGLTPAQQEKLAIHMAEHGFATHPLAELKWYTLDKLGLLFGKPWLVASPLVVYAQPVLVVIGSIGVLMLFWRKGLRLVPWLTLYLLVTQLPFLPLPRYAFPMMPFLFIGIGVVLQWLIDGILRRRRRT
ncbi:glycosyltransferase family 39 protein [Alicyclobacillus sp. ALC3]|uniref:glycosyltransferase family 39 protein n=1 Tax=Alicyclobacillus sp. ALC3 TaxID=2796143 RepID=UPI002378B30D|nr:glycosyltransferase family 39 protein [Alicyclobacillus sp. ALC3]WDL98307.1 glycosyltransferase family 39 protein [Alicyclobacillus sp. ALC3]